MRALGEGVPRTTAGRVRRTLPALPTGRGISCSLQTGRALAGAGLHPASGGDNTQLCSSDMLLEALAACAGVTLRAVAPSLGIYVESWSVMPRATSTSATRPALTARAPVGFKAIRLSSDLQTDADEELATLLKPTERYCVVYRTLAKPPELSATIA